MVRNIKTSNKGFTLIELLVVVAIIGILATAGIPQYKRMVAKSKQGEAKVALGEIATAESAFFSEYGGYGNNLRAMGIQSDIANEATNLVDANKIASKTYMYGFFDNACAVLAGGALPLPTAAGDAAQAALWANNQGYGTSFNNVIVAAGNPDSSSTVFGRTTLTGACNLAASVAQFPPAAFPYNTYRASASGVIKSGLNKNTCAIASALNSDCDVWTVDQNRNISNAIAGM